MIATRQRKRRSHSGRYFVAMLVVAAIGFVLGFPPTQHLIANGPLKPAWDAGTNVVGFVSRPLTFAGQQDALAQRNREMRDLNARLEAERQAKEAAETRTQQLETQLNTLANQPAPIPIPAPPVRRAEPAAAGGAAAPGTSATSDADRRLAATWAAMEPEKAAAIVQRLPDAQATRVLAAMDADSAGAIMNALPAPVAARLSRAQAQVR